MKRHLAIAAALLLGACSQLSAITSPKSPAQAVYDLRAGYVAAFLASAAAYNERPACSPTVQLVCRDPAVVDQLRKADAAALALLDGAEGVARAHPELNAATAIEAASSAVTAATKILTVYGIGGAKP